MAIDPGIFKAYDIRGLYGEQVDGETALAIGRGFARVLGKLSGKPPAELRVGLGRDMRLTAPELAARTPSHCCALCLESLRSHEHMQSARDEVLELIRS